MDLYCIRHSLPLIATGICYGQSDIGLADDFDLAFQAVHRQLSGLQNASIYSSPLQRCRKLAEALLATQCYHELVLDERLLELNFGDWELQAWDAIPRVELDAWANNYQTIAPPKGESYQALFLRVRQFLQTLTSLESEQAIIVSHAGVIRTIMAILNDISIADALSIHIPYASVHLVSFNGKIS